MSTRIVLVRHGQTEWNRIERFRGRADIDLNDVGMQQAEATAARLANLNISAIYSSPMKRALKTAQAAADLMGLQVRELPGVLDADYGRWQGLTLEEAEKRDPVVFANWRLRPHTVRFPDGESMEAVRQRAAQSVEALKPLHIDQTFAVVSHIAVCRMLVLHFLDVDTSHFWNVGQDNCAVSVFEIRDGMAVAHAINDTCHLRKPVSLVA